MTPNELKANEVFISYIKEGREAFKIGISCGTAFYDMFPDLETWITKKRDGYTFPYEKWKKGTRS